MKRAALLGVIALVACSDALEQTTTAGQAVAVVERAPAAVVRLVSAEDFSVRRVIPLSSEPSGQPTSNGSILLLAVGSDVVVFDFTTPNASGRTITVASTPGVAGPLVFQNSSVAWGTFDLSSLGAPNQYLVARINVVTGDTATRPLPALPRGIAIADGIVFVLLVAADETSWISAIDAATLATVEDSMALTPGGGLAITVGDDGFLYVVAGGSLTAGTGKGRLAIVDPRIPAEVAVINGLGDPIGAAVQHPSGRLLVPSLQGILEINTVTRSVTRGPGGGVMPEGDHPAALVFDQRGRVYGIGDRCSEPGAQNGRMYVLSPPPAFAVVKTVEVGACSVGGAAVLTQ